MVKTKLPNFGYQLQLASGAVEEHIQSKEEIKQFLNAVYGGRGPNGEVGVKVTKGIMFENLEKLGMTKLMSEEMLEYYTEQYVKSGMHGPCQYLSPLPIHVELNAEDNAVSWYRTREQNFQDELQ